VNGLLRVFNYELRRQGRRTGYLIVSFGLPIVAILLFYGIQVVQTIQNNAPGGTIVNSVSVAPGNASNPPAQQPAPANPSNSSSSAPGNSVTVGGGSEFGTGKIGIVDQSGLLSVGADTGTMARYPSVDAANQALLTNQIVSYYLIPADYVKTGKVEVWMTRFSLTATTNQVSQVLALALSQKIPSLDLNTLQRLIEKAPQVSNHRLNDANQVSQTADKGTSLLLTYGFAMALLITTFMTSGYLMQSLMEEKESRMLEILISSVQPGQLLAGKVLALGVLGLFQMILWGGTAFFLVRQIAVLAPALVGLQITPAELITLLMFFVLGYLMFAGVYAGISTVANTVREGPQYAAFFTIPALLPLYLVSVFAAQPDGPLAVGLSLFPVTAPMAMTMRIAISPVPLWQIVISAILLLLLGIALLWGAGKLFRLTMLMAGQSPKFSDIPRLIRESL
jgi:ABC-2 type transport system permease protein